ncbi:hypothetical protein QJS10_CPA03g00564 [Acorus calamus]|uniref:Uncharacterized protein n=1 Tax=Acorus calamus TaxID=4465 RepID=A0AAV9F3Q7_ACOCL|nr:hypothetical protein QJS10_CPA03g00564 [Acorus calamus]
MAVSTFVREKSLQNFCSSLEPLLRRVVREEVEHGLIDVVQFLQSNKLSLPIFTGSRIRGEDDIPLRIFLVNSNHDGRSVTSSLPSPIKIEIVVIDGDFPSDNRHDWTQNEFNSSIVRERAGKRPLLAGEKHYPPSLHDEVWRLEKIGKDGTFHRKLVEEGINTILLEVMGGQSDMP